MSAKGISKRTIYKEELAYGVVPVATGAKTIRRVTSNFNLAKSTYESNEIRTDYQRADFRHGIRSVTGSISGELSSGSYSDFIAAVVARDFTVNPTIAAIGTVTIAVTGNSVTLTRGAGSWITDLIVPGHVVRMTTGTGLVAANQNNNLGVLSMTATVLTCLSLSDTAFVAGAPTAVTVQAFGKSTFVPQTGHLAKSFTVEEFFSDTIPTMSEVYTGIKVGDVSFAAPTEGMITIDIALQGKNLQQTGTTQYFTSPTPGNLNGIFAGVSGAVVINGVVQGIVSAANFKIGRNLENANVIGSNAIAEVFDGTITGSGDFSMYLENSTPRDIFNAETRVGVLFFFTADRSPNSEFISVFYPSVKFSSADKSDAELGIMLAVPFEALLNPDTTGGKPQTTVFITDSQA